MLWLLGVTAVGLLVSSCADPGGSGGSARGDAAEGSSAGPAQDAANGQTPGALAFETGSTEQSIDGKVRLALARPATSMPALLAPAEQEAAIVADLLYDGLTEADAEAGVLRPGLATSWSPGPDGKDWTFVIDTDRVSLATVAAHFVSLRDEATGSTAVVIDQVTSVETVEPDRLRLQLASPNHGLPWLLSGVGFGVVGEGSAPTGRFDILADDDETLVLHDRNGSGPDVSITWTDSARDAYNLLTVGAVDVAVAPPDALADARSRYGITSSARAIARFYVLDQRSGRLADPRLRLAILAAVDRSRIVSEVMDVQAFALDGLTAPTLTGFARSGCGRSCTHDPERAARLVAELTVAEGTPTPEIRIGATSDQEAVAVAIAADLNHAGFDTTVAVLGPDELAAEADAGELEVYAAGWIAPATSMDAVAPLLASPSPVGADVATGSAVRALLEEAASTIDDHARWSLLANAHGEAMTSGDVLPVAVAKSYLVAAPHAQRIPVRADGSIDLFGFE